MLADVVGDDVVQVAGDPHPLVAHRALALASAQGRSSAVCCSVGRAARRALRQATWPQAMAPKK